jgi:hypothetical protein
MELAALFSFAILVVAWILAPDRPRTRMQVESAMPEATMAEAQSEPQPIAA